MKKSYLILGIVIFLIIGAVTAYYYMQYNRGTKAANTLDRKAFQSTLAKTDIKGNKNMDKDNKEKKDKEFKPGEEKKDSIGIPDYKLSFRDPFADFREPLEDEAEIADKLKGNKAELTPEKLKSNLPFKLEGIVGKDNNWYALINTGNKTELINRGDEIKGFQVVEITEDNLHLVYRDIFLTIDLRSGLGD